MPIKVAVFNNKGGVGKTTLSIILTQVALMQKQRVLAFDQDEQCNFCRSMSYLQNEDKFKNLFTLKTSLEEKDFNTSADWIIIDCPPGFNERLRFALKNADIILIPVRPDSYSLMHLSRIHSESGEKRLFQYPLVKIGFNEGNLHNKSQAAKIASCAIEKKKYVVIGNLPIYATITANISSDLRKWWCVGLQKSAREPFELIYTRITLLYQKLQAIRKKEAHQKEAHDTNIFYGPDSPRGW